MERIVLIVGGALVASGLAGAAWMVAQHGGLDGAGAGPGLMAAAPGSLGGPMAAPLRFDDPRGDAWEDPAAAEAVLCPAAAALAGDCLPASPAAAPAPYFDLLGVRFDGEGPGTFRVALEVADIPEGWGSLGARHETHRAASYAVCWGAPRDACADRAVLHVMVHPDGAHVEPHLHLDSEECNEWRLCTWGVAASVEFGSPATIAFDVPKGPAGFARPLELRTLQGVAGWTEEPSVLQMWHLGVTAHTPARHTHAHLNGLVLGGAADVTEAFEAGLVLLAPGPLARDAGAPLLTTMPGTHSQGLWYDTPALDLLAVDLHEDGPDLVVRFALAEVPPASLDMDLALAMGLARDLVWEVGVRQHGGHAQGYAGRCIMNECQHAPLVEVPFEVRGQAPAVVEVRVPLALMGSPRPGTLVTLLSAATMYNVPDAVAGGHGGELSGEVHSAFMVDMAEGGEPYVFGGGHRANEAGLLAGHGHGGHHGAGP